MSTEWKLVPVEPTQDQKTRAHRITKSAIKRGELVRPELCSRCGMAHRRADGINGIQAHHPDYSQPLLVEWLCSKCHRKDTPLPEKPGAPVFGSKNGQAKLTEADVISARRLRTTGLSYQKIADRFGVDKRAAMRAVKGEQWSHVKEES